MLKCGEVDVGSVGSGPVRLVQVFFSDLDTFMSPCATLLQVLLCCAQLEFYFPFAGSIVYMLF